MKRPTGTVMNYKFIQMEYPAIYKSKETGEEVRGKRIEYNRYAILINGEKVYMNESELKSKYKYLKVERKCL